MKHDSLNTIDIFGRLMCCGSSIYSLAVTRDSMVITRSAINHCHDRGIENPWVHCRAATFDIWVPSGVFS